MCTTPKSSKAAKPKNRVSGGTSPDSYRSNLAAMRGASDHFDEFDRDAEQFRSLVQNRNKVKNKDKKLDSGDAVTKKSRKKSSETGSWVVQFRGFWRRLF